MLPDGTLVVPIRDDADGSDDEEELSGIIEVKAVVEPESNIPLLQLFFNVCICLLHFVAFLSGGGGGLQR